MATAVNIATVAEPCAPRMTAVTINAMGSSHAPSDWPSVISVIAGPIPDCRSIAPNAPPAQQIKIISPPSSIDCCTWSAITCRSFRRVAASSIATAAAMVSAMFLSPNNCSAKGSDSVGARPLL